MPSSQPKLTLRARYLHTLFALLLAGACGSKETAAKSGAPGLGNTELEALEFRYQGNNGNVLYHELAQELGYLAPLKLKWVGNTISGPQDIQTVLTGDVDVGGAFNGAIVKLVAAKAPIRAVQGYYGVDDQTWSAFFVPEASPIKEPKDLIGKKVAMNTLGAHSEFMLREWLGRAGLSAEQIKQVTLVVVPPISAEQSLRQGQVDVAVLGGILRDRALNTGGVRKLFSDHDLYGSFTAGSLVVAQKTLRERPNAVRKLVDATGRAIEWARSQPRDVVRAKYAEVMRKRARGEDPSIVQYWRSTGIAGRGGRIAEREIQMWIDWLVKDGGIKPGQLKPSDVFTNDFNPFPSGEQASNQATGTQQ